MFRSIVACPLLLPLFAFAAEEPKEVPKELQPFQGVWKVVKAEGGPKNGPDKLHNEVRFGFAGNKLTIREGQGPVIEATYAVDPKAEPASIDLISANKEKSLGIFRFETDGRLIISYVAGKPGAPRPKKFGDSDAVQVVLEKVKEKDKDKPETKKAVAKDMVPFQGDWKVLQVEVGGKPPPGGQPASMRFVFKGDLLEISEGKEPPKEGGYVLDSTKEPAEIDLVTPEKHKIPGIFKFDKNGQLTITLAIKPNAKRPTKFDEGEVIKFVMEKSKE